MTQAQPPVRTAVIVEDDPDVRSLLVDVFEGAGFSTVAVDNGIDGVHAVLSHQPLITTLDVTMPGIDGLEAARRIRARSDTYIVMLTAMNEEADVVLGLTAGADEYVSKPFRPREFRARIDAILRRTQGATVGAAGVNALRGHGGTTPPARSQVRDTAPSPSPVSAATAGGAQDRDASEAHLDATAVEDGADPGEGHWLAHRNLRLDVQSRIVLIDDDEIDLTRTEFDLLAALLESRRRVRSKSDLSVVLRGESYVTSSFVGDADKRAIEAHMTNLRRKIGDNPAQPRFIETVRGVGYRLTADVTSPQV